jgi:transcriptional regulator with PAS, ATPase and Fis domain
VCEGECVLRGTLDTGKAVVNKAIYIVDADGNRTPISVSTALLRDKEGRVIGGVETFRDLSLVEELRKELAGHYTFADMVSKSRAMRKIFEIIPEAAASESTILIEGESGTGKELLARAIHTLSPRKDKPFVAVNCGALPDTLLESELFGYVAGAFTGAAKDKPGRFLQARGGTIFLDEIGDVSPALQVRLLRVLQDNVVEPLGSVESIDADVRVVAATNRNLNRLVENGTFRSDLYYRVNVVRLELPPLRERREDIPLLLDHFITRFSRLRGKDIAGMSTDALRRLAAYDFPGNVRELENIVEYAFVVCSGGLIELSHLPPHLRKSPTSRAVPAGSLRDLEKQRIEEALVQCGGNRQQAADLLGIHKSTLFRKVKRLGIRLPAVDGKSRQPSLPEFSPSKSSQDAAESSD